jgi:PAS domain S-box-containing protein
MGLHIAAGLNRWAKSVEPKTQRAGQLNIGPRLILGFVFIILSMLTADAVVLWQFNVVRTQVARMNDIDQKLVAVLRVHTSLLAFYERLDALADSEDAGRLITEAGPLRTAVLEHIHRATSALSLPPFDLQRDPTILPTLQVIQSALPSQLEGITTLATSGDWRAVHLRLANQVRPLESLASALVEKVAHEASDQQAQIVLNIRRVQRLVFLVVPLTAVVTLLIAATLGLAITRSITQPLARLVEGSKALARGEFQHQVSVTGRDELADLGHVFNDTARRLRDLYATLQRNEDQLRRVIDTIPAHAWSTLPDGSVDFINRRFLDFAGRSPEDLRGWGWGSVVHPDDLTRYADQWRAAVASGEPMESQARVRRADGDYRWLLIRNVPLRDELGNIVNWYGTAFDIQDRHRAEEALRQAQADLAHVSRVTTLGEMAASIAHEVDQPLSGVVITANACLRFLSGESPNLDEVRDGLRAIARDGRRASEVTARIRSLARRTPTEREPLDINEVIREVVVLADGEARRTRARVRTELAGNLPRVLGDPVELQQVVLNLLLNGLDAMSAVVDRQRELVISTYQEVADGVHVAVQDSGSGIDPQLAHRMFEAFYSTKRGGMGMGLSISRTIIEHHGGRLWAVPNDGPGTTFHFTV